MPARLEPVLAILAATTEATGWSVLQQAIVTVGAVLVAAVPLGTMLLRRERRNGRELATLQEKADRTYAHVNSIEEGTDTSPGMTLGQLVQHLDQRVAHGFAQQDAVLAEVLRQVRDQGESIRAHSALLDAHGAALEAHRMALDAHSSAIGALGGRAPVAPRSPAYTRQEQR